MSRFDWCPCYLDKWHGESVKMLSLAAQGAYWAALTLQFKEGSIPADLKKLAKLIGCDSSDLKDIWPEISDKFEEIEPGRLVNPQMADVRAEQLAKQAKDVEKGKRGAEGRWRKDATSNARGMQQALLQASDLDATGIATTIENGCSEHATSNAQAMAKRKEEKRREREVLVVPRADPDSEAVRAPAELSPPPDPPPNSPNGKSDRIGVDALKGGKNLMPFPEDPDSVAEADRKRALFRQQLEQSRKQGGGS